MILWRVIQSGVFVDLVIIRESERNSLDVTLNKMVYEFRREKMRRREKKRCR